MKTVLIVDSENRVAVDSAKNVLHLVDVAFTDKEVLKGKYSLDDASLLVVKFVFDSENYRKVVAESDFDITIFYQTGEDVDALEQKILELL